MWKISSTKKMISSCLITCKAQNSMRALWDKQSLTIHKNLDSQKGNLKRWHILKGFQIFGLNVKPLTSPKGAARRVMIQKNITLTKTAEATRGLKLALLHSVISIRKIWCFTVKTNIVLCASNACTSTQEITRIIKSAI